MSVEIVSFDPAAATEELVRECYDVDFSVFKLDYPDRPVPTLEGYADQLRNQQSLLGPRRLWLARDAAAGAVVGLAAAVFPEDENVHMSVVHVKVKPQHRRKGIGTEMFRTALSVVRESGRELIGSEGLKAGADGEKWASAHGLSRVSELVLQRLHVEASAEQLQQRPLPAGYHAGIWVGAIPEDVIAPCADVLIHGNVGTIAQADRRELEWSEDRLRQFELEIRESGNELWTAAAVRDDDSTVAAVTMIAVPLGTSEYCYQQDTVVLPQLRRRGLATSVKAALIGELATRRPDIKQVFTHIDHRNEPMLRMNEGLGFRTDDRVARFEATVEDLESTFGL
jgi:mycothiol synthase